MSLGTLDRTPPPFFRQGPSALTKLTFFSALALLLMVADTRFQITQPVRAVIATVLHPVERTLLVPVAAWEGGSDYLVGLQKALTQADAARRDLARQAERSLRLEQVEADNRRLRALLELRPALTVRSLAAEVLYDAPDAFSRKVVIDRGATHGVAIASPVVNEAGVLGQVTRVYPLSSEVTLLNDKDAAIPVLNTRNQVRSAAFGVRNGMELRFMAGNADVQVGDLLSTSGVDGIYPPGLPVAKVTLVDRKIDTSFARIVLEPVALSDAVRYVLVLEPVGMQMPAKPEPVPEDTKPAPKKGGRR
ncbi:rod shape-determining protein MreC [Rhizobacter sp. AJA081-3]|uniref:rod shape-determining protein MreC n=1 Tax=Rhizobacter sp. AJA081-3 TaxID=2753607 RepID=UPI001AE05C98|nr:rod shape-determining protein MreC [Rhizobacter sp. AJA081-3]QTN22918.1 rod shape-determining protein MreC [Rhizobacter sp. AJA081-3]